MCYPWSNHNATSVLQRREPGQIEKQKQKKTKTKQSNHIESYFYCPIKSSLSRKCFPSPPPPQNKTKENKRRKQYKTKHKSKKL